MKFLIHHVHELDSTNDTLLEEYESLPDGYVLMADHQNKGKGRRGRVWEDDSSSLLFSILLKDHLEASRISLLTLLVGSALSLSFDPLGIKSLIKWPNDVLVNGKKVSGILLESVSLDHTIQALVIGIGINVNTASFPQDIAKKATSLKLEKGKTYDKNAILSSFLHCFDTLYEDFKNHDSRFLSILRERSYLKDKNIYLNYYGENLHAKVLSIDDKGDLVIEDKDHSIRHIHAGEVTLENNYQSAFQSDTALGNKRKEKHMKEIDLSQYGINDVKGIIYNPSYDELYKAETDPSLTGYEKGQVTELGAVNVMTGIYTGRSPKDKYIVVDENSKNTVWWNTKEYPNDNHPMNEDVWEKVRDLARKELSGKHLYVVDGFSGANKDTRMPVRFIMEVAWQAHFVRNMFIRPTAEEEASFKPEFVVYCASKAAVDNYKELGLHSSTCVAFNITSHEQVILNTWYGGEMKKGIFSMQNYYLPLKGIASMHSSANTDLNGENTCVFFGLSGTGKTTLSTDPKRLLIGDDEHGWDDNGVFNLEGGCYAKVIDLDKDAEPDIYGAIKRDALLENVTVDKDGKIDFHDKSVTENTRVSYPIYHINKIVKPISHGPAAKNVIFLSADAFGVLPPVSILNAEQTKYYFLSGFTAKLAGTERGITEPTPTFSACFGQAFLELHPTKYAEELVRHMQMSGAKAYLVNTGWNGSGKRISIKDTRGIITAIQNGAILKSHTKKIPYFDFEVPTELEGVDTHILDPKDTYADPQVWDEKARHLAELFIKNFHKYETNDAGKALVKAGPHLD